MLSGIQKILLFSCIAMLGNFALPSQAQCFSWKEAERKLSVIQEKSPHTRCIKKSDIKACVELIAGGDEYLYYDKVTSNLTLKKKSELSNILIGYVLNNQDILLNRKFTHNERKMQLGLRRDQYQYGSVERIPSRLIEKVYSFDIKSSNFFRYIATPRNHRTYAFLKKSAMQKETFPHDEYAKLITKTYYKRIVNGISDVPVFFENVLPTCSSCDQRKYVMAFMKLPSYGVNVKPSSPRKSIEFKYIFEPAMKNGWVDHKVTDKYQSTLVTSVSEIPYFIENVLAKCSDCNRNKTYRKLMQTPGFGNGAKNFFDSIEYHYVLKHLPVNVIADKYIAYAVNSVADIPGFYSKVVKPYGLNNLKYLKKLSKTNGFASGVTLGNFFNSIEYQYVYKYLTLTTGVSLRGATYYFQISTNTVRGINQSFNANCSFSRSMQRNATVGFFDPIFATSKINYFNVYKCHPTQADYEEIKSFSTHLNNFNGYRQLQASSGWEDQRYTSSTFGYEKRVVRSFDGGSTPSNSTSNSSSRASSSTHASSGSTNGVKEIYDGGSKSSKGHVIYRVKCNSGRSASAYQDSSGWWKTGTGSKYGEKYRHLSRQAFAQKFCQ